MTFKPLPEIEVGKPEEQERRVGLPLANSRHEIFAQELAKGSYATDAYETAGFKRHDGNSSTLANRPDIEARVEEIRVKVAEKVANKVAINKAYVLTRLVENLDRAMQAEEIQGKDGGTGEFKYDGSVANRALELIGKELGMFVDRKELGGPGDFAAMGDGELLEKIKDRAALLGLDVPKTLHS